MLQSSILIRNSINCKNKQHVKKESIIFSRDKTNQNKCLTKFRCKNSVLRLISQTE